MMKKRGKSTQKTIDIFNKEEIGYWCDKLRCEKKVLLDAVLTVGKELKKVKIYLKAQETQRKRNKL